MSGKKDKLGEALNRTVEEGEGLERFRKADAAIEGEEEPKGRADSWVVRDSFSFPPDDHAIIGRLMDRYPALLRRTSKSELVRAGLHLLENLSDDELAAELDKLERVRKVRSK